jgi:hypothetical protein
MESPPPLPSLTQQCTHPYTQKHSCQDSPPPHTRVPRSGWWLAQGHIERQELEAKDSLGESPQPNALPFSHFPHTQCQDCCEPQCQKVLCSFKIR